MWEPTLNVPGVRNSHIGGIPVLGVSTSVDQTSLSLMDAQANEYRLHIERSIEATLAADFPGVSSANRKLGTPTRNPVRVRHFEPCQRCPCKAESRLLHLSREELLGVN